MGEPDYITVIEAAAEVSKHPRTIKTWIADGKLPGYRVAGWGVLVDRNELRALITPISTTRPA